VGAHRLSPARRVFAVLATLLVGPGGGHVVVGRLRRGALWLAGAFAVLLLLPKLGLWALLAAGIVYVASSIDAAASQSSPERPPTALFVTGVLLIWVALFAGFRAIVRATLAESFRVPSGTMAPSVLPGDLVLIDKLGGGPRRGDIVAFHRQVGDKNQDYLKRVVATGGDSVAVEQGLLIVNGTPAPRARLPGVQAACAPEAEDLALQADPSCALEQETLDGHSYRIAVEHERDETLGDFAALVVPDGHVFVLGDNRMNSLDSRHFGPVPHNELIGVARYVLIGFSNGGGPRWDRVNLRLD
jgi:signal peptidase I